jgi:hypothetical protein
MMPAQTSRPRPSGPTCTCLPRQSTLAPSAASESPRATEAVAPRASSTQVGHRQRVDEQVFVDPPEWRWRTPWRSRSPSHGGQTCRSVLRLPSRAVLIVLAVILIGVPIWALIWGQKERRPQKHIRKISRTSRVLDPLEGRPERTRVAIVNDAPEPRSSTDLDVAPDRARPARSLPASRSCRA